MTVGQEETEATTRRAMLRAAAWTVPVVAATVAAPAFAASPCPTTTVAWSGFADGTHFTSGSSAVFGGVTVTLTYTGSTAAPNNANVYTATPTGGVSSALRFFDENTSSTNQTVTFTFSKTVTNLSFSLLDVDSATNSFYDQVLLNTTGYTATLGSTVQGNGTAGNLFRGTGANTAVAGTSSTGNVGLTWTAGLTSVSFTYSQYAGTVNGSPFIGVSNLSFKSTSC